MRIGGYFALLLLLGGCAAAAPEDTHDIYIHSDIPLALPDLQAVWPHYCVNSEIGGNCSPFGFGDWKMTPAGCRNATCEQFVRLGFDGEGYGFDEADVRRRLAFYGTPALIFKLETQAASDLYALQVGYRGGSRYIVLSATPGSGGLVAHMTILDVRCLKLPRVQWRRSISVPYEAEEDYCAVNSMAALVAIAREARNRPPAASLDYLGSMPDENR